MSFSKPSGTAKLTVPVGGSFAHTGSFAMGSLNKLSGSSFIHRSQPPHEISFKDGWRKGPTQAWYEAQLAPDKSTIFHYLEYRKERESPFYHEFIVAELDNGTVCRFDRRGDITNHVNRVNVFIGEPIPAEDTAQVIDKSTDDYFFVCANSHLLLKMHFPQGQNLLTLLAICYGIQKNKNTQSYSLTRYNCYFFSWMMVIGIARHTINWELLTEDHFLWDKLVASATKSLEEHSRHLEHFKRTTSATFGTKNKNASLPGHFIGSPYLIKALRKALGEARGQILKALSELVFESTVEKAMFDLAETSAQRAANQAARSHATHAARDAAMEAVIEAMWRDIIASPEGENLWESTCRLAEECVRNASAAAAEAAGQSRRIIIIQVENPVPEAGTPNPAADGGEAAPAPPTKWETAWDASWEETWSSGNESGTQRSNTTGSRSDDPSKTSISDRAKASWFKAWEDACQANEQYVPLISRGVADYVTNNLPPALPEVLTYQTNPNVLKSMINALVPADNSSNTKLQEWVKNRIQDHCQRLFRMWAKLPNRAEFEDTMGVVWISALSCLKSTDSGLAGSETPTF
ncbi:hypothetical protein FRC11_012087 [Ceratobasidium sp. 423]|nr:hypothetical protein FRC11_012087 [Ceratobasidium sp. 423]